MDLDEPSVISSANTNIGRQSGAETLPDGATVYFNTPFKWTADASPQVGRCRLTQ